MKLLAQAFSTAETTLIGTTAGAGGYAGGNALHIQKVVAMCGGSSVAANSSGGVKFNFGNSSGAVTSTLAFPTPKSADATSAGSAAPFQWELSGLDIFCNWFEAATNEAAHGGWFVAVFSD